ncbi:MAG: hypothetical protein KDK70_27965 [Myxococcales bacterium]|nr:hypothetical protein [Myxococcales bacterium]
MPMGWAWGIVVVVGAAALSIAGCVDDASTHDEDGTTAGTTGGTMATQTVTASATGVEETTTTAGMTSMPSTDTADDGSSGGGQCPALADDPSPGTITIEITNARAEGIWVPLIPDCIESVPYEILAPDGQVVAWQPPPCGTCEGAVQGRCPCPPPACEEYTGLYVEAGGTAQYRWSGLAFVDEAVPESCPGIEACGASCRRAVLTPAGTHTLAIQAGRASGCATEPCACTPMDGWCTLYDAGMTFTMLQDFGATLELPGDTMVQIVID